MSATPNVRSANFRPWLTIWFHPRHTIQQIVETNPWHWIYLLVPLAGIASGIGDWLNAVLLDSDTYQENVLWAVGSSLVVGTAIALAACLVLQWITVRSGVRIPYSHLAAAYFWAEVPLIGFLLVFIVILIGATLATMLIPAAAVMGVWGDLFLILAWLLAGIWSAVLAVGTLSQVMRCSAMTAIGRGIIMGLILAIPVWALTSLFSSLGSRDMGDVVIYQRPGAETGIDLAAIMARVAVLVVSAVVLFAMYRSSRARSTVASLDRQEDAEV